MQKFEQGENGAVKFHNLTLNRRKNKAAVTAGDRDIKNYIRKTPLTAINRLISRLSIAKKITYGYSLAIGIAVLGTTGGMLFGDYYQKQAFQALTFADEQQHLLRDLEYSVQTVQSHPKRLISVLGDSIWFEYETAKFLKDVDVVNTNIAELAFFTEEHSTELAVNSAELKELLNGYTTATDSYSQLLKSFWQQLDTSSLKPAEVKDAQQQVLDLIRGNKAVKLDVKFERLSESLSLMTQVAKAQQREAYINFNKAEDLRVQIIVVSMLVSVAIAIFLAICTSRAIALPLQAVTRVAKTITQQANFDLQVPVTTEDDVGTLAKSINQLVQWVAEYTHELELARQTLEERVEERTEELTAALYQLKHTQTQLIQTEKMSSLGQMVAGVAHEINNPVNFIHGNLEYAHQYIIDLLKLIRLYQQEYPQPTEAIAEEIAEIELDFITEDLLKLLESMKIGSERIRQIVLSLRNFSRLDEAQMKLVDIHEGIDNTLLILSSRLKQGIEVIKNYGELPEIECYPAQLNQVFMNIIVNAIDALEESGDNSKKSKIPQILIQTQKLDSSQIRVRISDNGPGISLAIQNKLFDPFFTTKAPGKGTGIGLAICYQIVEKHRGKIEVISSLGGGAEFAITLPASSQT
ncbi:sensor histidine kinase [Microcoleus vaginatus]|uniref:sensor histidine kinase n=1 Tax=Microcoleus vaginatus TaxID=119532 RepID=UPI001F6144C5|nr:HAMP domain-containing protein [Microcoleus vaginatus HSN003]